ncbi:unnamed protein product [Linum tenue]|uniref:Survival of motor neuron-related-splicing factor 30 n=1 Tax=Linum tenue TaxID=586396 RepID=A0AAV0LW06_9ROSI|nr:unnamed protein product [Linum tenue]CAI0437711.1 unnamed protein product [Linum tenue]
MQVIALTEELLATAKQSEVIGSGIGTRSSVSPTFGQSDNSDQYGKFPVGSRVQAVWSEDGEWYDATVEAITPNGYFVAYDEWGNKEEVDPDNVRPVETNALVEAERVAEATKQAIKRKIAQAASSDFQARTLPAKLRIQPEDPEDVKVTKRKKIHAFKSKRESIFKSPDDPHGKVGVTGSGKGLTDFQRREKHLHLKGGSAETDD